VTYVIVDEQTKTRTCIHTPASEGLQVQELDVSAILRDTAVLFSDSRLLNAMAAVAEEAHDKGIPIFLDIEKDREGLENVLRHSTYLNTSHHYMSVTFSGDNCLTRGQAAFLFRYPELRWVATTIGERGAVLMSRDPPTPASTHESSVEDFAQRCYDRFRKAEGGREVTTGTILAKSKDGAEAVFAVHYCPPIRLAEKEVVDTTGAGDTFIGTCMFGLLSGFDVARMLNLACINAGTNCKFVGARGGMLSRDALMELEKKEA